jgi:hypothetical protein
MKLAGLLTSAVLLAASVAAVTAGDAPVVAAHAAASKAATCRHVSGPFRRDQNMIIGAGGQRYIPYGITVTGLGSPSWKVHSSGDDAEIGAAAASWCANTIRLQIFQYALLGWGKTGKRGVTVNHTFLGQIKGQVDTALDYGLVVVLNDQTEGNGNKYFPGMPTAQTKAFWKVMSAVYGSNPDVIFDLFNEPRRAVYPTEAGTWRFWKHGGDYEGHPFVGMEPLARYIRGLGARNLFWVEGPHTAGTLDQIVNHQITGAGPVEYTINHPGGPRVPHNPAEWYRRFGYASGKVPMTDAEWTNYSSTRACWANAPTSVPAFLDYLGRHGMGLLAWTLTPGVLAASANLADPTVIRSDWACADTGLDEGAGRAIMNWFRRHNS